MRTLLTAISLALTLLACHKTAKVAERTAEQEHEDHWGYTGENDPDHWAELSNEFVKCAEGQLQSPIDIQSYKAHEAPAVDLVFNYQPSPVDAVNNGHTVQANLEAENHLLLKQHKYVLKQIHFHQPAEHRLNGIIFPMEIHLVHADSSGKLAVVGLFVQEGPENEVLEELWEHLPAQTQEHYHPQKGLDLVHLLPEEQAVYHYRGSLTTPPCSEGVEWLIMQRPIAMSKEQIQRFMQLYHGNNRPVQELHEREVEVLTE